MDQVGRQLKEAQAFETEILRKSRDHETLNSKGQELISTSDRDEDAVQSVLDAVNNRWTDLTDGMLLSNIQGFFVNKHCIQIVSTVIIDQRKVCV